MKRYLLPLLIVAVILACGCGNSSEPSQTVTPTLTVEAVVTAEVGDTVRVDYTGWLDDGTQFDSSIGREPWQFTLGQGEAIYGFDEAVIGMSVGETKTVKIPADEAYGQYREDLVLEVSRDEFPPEIDPVVGKQLQMMHNDGSVIFVTVIEVSESSVTLDANHSLAGKDLNFEIQLVEIL